MTADAIGCHGDVTARLTGGRRAVMAGGALRGHGKATVVNPSPRPAAGVVARLTPPCNRAVSRIGRFTGQSIRRCEVASGALTRHRHVGMKASRIPRCVPRLVARVAIGRGWDVVPRLAGCRTAVVAGDALS